MIDVGGVKMISQNLTLDQFNQSLEEGSRSNSPPGLGLGLVPSPRSSPSHAHLARSHLNGSPLTLRSILPLLYSKRQTRYNVQGLELASDWQARLDQTQNGMVYYRASIGSHGPWNGYRYGKSPSAVLANFTPADAGPHRDRDSHNERQFVS